MLSQLYGSPVLKKVVTGITGIFLTLFVLVHMTGNLAFFSSEEAYNAYSHFLTHQLGALFYVIEIGLVAIFAFHATIGISIWLGKRRARPQDYATYESAGGASRQSLASRSMILTGILLLVFTVFHLVTFKYGTYYEITLSDGTVVRDIARLVREQFSNPVYAFGYPAMMLLLALHLRHGVWSALQSLGLVRPGSSASIYLVGGLLGLLIGVGFLLLPIAIYFGWA